ncbi:uncharacterized protein [Miscanthus floridulus]|uniref:uncharacterized protein isoform X2 n=1 Tax=Miscanthus floridulus TaxID=154761 RepID=UPI003457AB1B
MAIRAGRSALHLLALAFLLILAASPCLQARVDHRKQISDWSRRPNFELQNICSSRKEIKRENWCKEENGSNAAG